MSDNRLSKNVRIACYETDAERSLKPYSFMDYAQEIAGEHSELLGAGYDELIKNNQVWIISRMHILFVRPPLWRDKVQLSTWSRGLQGPFYVRDCEMRTPGGELLVASTSSWVILNLSERTFVRTPGVLSDNSTICTDESLPACSKIRVPSDVAMTHISSHKVCYSDVDKNLHANNAKYVQWTMDALDCELTAHKSVKELEINFHHECRLNQTVDVYTGTTSCDSHIYVVGKVDGEVSFTMKLIF